MNSYLIRKLKEGRLSKGYKQSDIAELIGIKKNTISNYENGVTEPDIDTFLELCRIYDLDYASILEEAYNYKSPNIDFSLGNNEIELIKKYRSLDDYGKKQIDNTLELEYKRVQELDNVQFTTYDDAMNYLLPTPIFAMGGINLEEMEEQELIEFANDQYEMEKKYLK